MKEGEGEKESNLSAPHRSDRPSDRIGGFISPPARVHSLTWCPLLTTSYRFSALIRVLLSDLGHLQSDHPDSPLYFNSS